MSNFGTNLRTLREAAGLTQQQVADRAGMPRRGSISDIEHGRQDPPESVMERLAKAVGSTVSHLTREEK